MGPNKALLLLFALTCRQAMGQSLSATFDHTQGGAETSFTATFDLAAMYNGPGLVTLTIPSLSSFGRNCTISVPQLSGLIFWSLTVPGDVSFSFDDALTPTTFDVIIGGVFLNTSAANVQFEGKVYDNTATKVFDYTAVQSTSAIQFFGDSSTNSAGASPSTANTYIIGDAMHPTPTHPDGSPVVRTGYVVHNVTLRSDTVAGWNMQTGKLKVWTRNSDGSLTLASNNDLNLIAASQVTTLELTGPRPRVYNNAVFGFYTPVNALALGSTCASSKCYGGVFSVPGDVNTSLANPSAFFLGAQYFVGAQVQIGLGDTDQTPVSIIPSAGEMTYSPTTTAYRVAVTVGTSVTMHVQMAVGFRGSVVQIPPNPIALTTENKQTLVTVQVFAEDYTLPPKNYTINLVVPTVPYPMACPAVIGSVNTVCQMTGQFFADGFYDYSGCLFSFLGAHLKFGIPPIGWTTNHISVEMTCNQNYVLGGMTFFLFAAAPFPSQFPVDPTLDVFSGITVQNATVTAFDSLGANVTTLGGQIVLGIPNYHVYVTVESPYLPYSTIYRTFYDIHISIVSPTAAKNISQITPNAMSPTLTIQLKSPLDKKDFGQFTCDLIAALGTPYDGWRFIVLSTNGNKVVLVFLDVPIEPTRISQSSAQSLRDGLKNGITGSNTAISAELAAGMTKFPIDTTFTPTTGTMGNTALPAVQPCEGGQWYILASVADPPLLTACGLSAADQAALAVTSGSDTSKRYAAADALVSIFTIGSVALAVFAAIYYKFISKSAGDSEKAGSDLEKGPASDMAAPVAIAPLSVTAPSATDGPAAAASTNNTTS